MQKRSKMPKFQRTCNNPFHKTWSKGEEVKILNLRARGLVGIGTNFDKYIEEETGKTSTTGHRIKYLCTICLKECFRKRKFTKLLPNDQFEELKMRLERQVFTYVYTKNIAVQLSLDIHTYF